MRQLVHGDRGSCWPLMVEVLAINLVLSREIIHVDEKSRYLGNVAQIRSGTGQNVAHILDHCPGLRANIEARCAKLIHVGSGDRIIRTSSTCPGNEQKIPSALY